MDVVVVGANGQLGQRCCQLLLERGHRVRGVVRTPDRGQALREQGSRPCSATSPPPPGCATP